MLEDKFKNEEEDFSGGLVRTGNFEVMEWRLDGRLSC